MLFVTVKHYCPCCGYDGLLCPAYSNLGPPPWPDLGKPPYASHLGFPSHEVCACCGFEFGFDDDPGATTKSSSFEQYRAVWLALAAEWFSPRDQPAGWDLPTQLANIGVAADA